MKKALLFILYLSGFMAAQAQTEQETLEWLNVKQENISLYDCSSHTVPDNTAIRKVEITNTYIKLSNEKNAYSTIRWTDIKEVRIEREYIKIICEEKYEGENRYIRLRILNGIQDKFAKAIEHMAKLKGAKLIKNDLF